jgi:branched-chain amino acid transport system substrate-binding protein
VTRVMQKMRPFGKRVPIATAFVLLTLGLNIAAAAPADARSSNTPHGTPYVIGVEASESGPVSTAVAPQVPGVQAWVDWTNAHGGVNGHPVKAIVMDSGGNPTTALTQVKELVEKDHIIALIPLSAVETTYASYLDSAKVPAIGGVNTGVPYSQDGFFSVNNASAVINNMVAYAAQKKGLKKVAIMACVEVTSCPEAVATINKFIPTVGAKTVSSQGISSSAANYTTQCLKAKSSGANVLIVFAGPTQAINVSKSCVAQGYKAPQLIFGTTINNEWLGQSSLNGTISSNANFPFTDDSLPATKAFHQAIKQYEPKALKNSLYGSATAQGWTAAAIFGAAAAHLGNTPSAAGVYKGLYAMKNETLGGLTAPITYVKSSTNPNTKLPPCSFIMTIQNEKFAEPQGLKPYCFPATKAR